jgi:uncharacterized membrane protein SirB2
MTEAVINRRSLSSYTLLLGGFSLLFINHISVVMGNPWLIPELLKLQ